MRGDRNTDAQADDPAYDRRASGVAATTMTIIPATMPVLGMRGGGYPQARDEHRRGQETYTSTHDRLPTGHVILGNMIRTLIQINCARCGSL